MKKMLTFLLALARVLTMHSFALADEPVTIRIAHWDVETALGMGDDAVRDMVE